MTVSAGLSGAPFTMHTSAVDVNTSASVSADWQGAAFQAQLTLTPQQPPASLTIDPATTTGTNGSSGRIALASTASTDVQILLQSRNPSVASVPSSVTVPAFAAALRLLHFYVRGSRAHYGHDLRVGRRDDEDGDVDGQSVPACATGCAAAAHPGGWCTLLLRPAGDV
jgi:hypothetical protein